MAKILDESMLKSVIDEMSSSAYFFQREKEKEIQADKKALYDDEGNVVVIFTTGIASVEPNEEDLLGRIWKPRLKDKEGNPILDAQGRKREPWAKYEAKAVIKGKELIYGFGGKNGVLFRGFCSEMGKNGIKNTELPNTKWKIKCINMAKWKWDISFLGKEEAKLPKKTNGNGKPEEVPIVDKVIGAIADIKRTNAGRVLAGLSKTELIEAIGFKVSLDEKKILSVWQELVEKKVILEDGNKVYIQ